MEAKSFEYLEEKVSEILNLGPGYKFSPRGVHPIVPFLLNKILGQELPVNLIMEVEDLYKINPMHLPPMPETRYLRKNERFYFTHREEDDTSSLQAPGGYWEENLENEKLVLNSSKVVVGFMKHFDFYIGEKPHGKRSPWTSLEYRIIPAIIPQNSLNNDIEFEVQTLRLCKIKCKKDEVRNEDDGGHLVVSDNDSLVDSPVVRAFQSVTSPASI